MPLTASAHSPCLFLSACEASGDLHGARLMGAIRAVRSDCRFIGIGGDRMIDEGLEAVFHARELGVMGITDVLGRLGTVRRAFSRAIGALQGNCGKVDQAVLIDSASFHLRLAAHAKAAGVPVTCFIAPKVWASRAGRMKVIRQVVDQMLVILPFEEPLFRSAGVPVAYVGNPLVDEQAEELAQAPTGGWKPSDFGLEDGRPTVALLPGSRAGEVHYILPGLLETAREVRRRLPDSQFLLPVAASVDSPELRARVAAAGAPVTVVAGQAVAVLNAADVAAIASGTATLQAALAGTPGAIVYRVSRLTWMIARPLVRLPYVGLPNLVAEREVMPELLQNDFIPSRVADYLCGLLSRPEALAEARANLAGVARSMGESGASERVAGLVLRRLEAA
ncbi:MAG: lipid-A-disaccharide synthase [Nitrospirota bacterium]|nr:lipid-A-disaccharide synthase [Nitrospirota bacterium]